MPDNRLSSGHMKNFNDSVAKEYEQDIRKKILGYDVMQNLITILINHELPLNSSILVVGCGTGEEIVRLEKLSSSYQIIGIDPSQDMILSKK
jgi:tRNA (cmo5U34)-methyltransferase